MGLPLHTTQSKQNAVEQHEPHATVESITIAVRIVAFRSANAAGYAEQMVRKGLLATFAERKAT